VLNNAEEFLQWNNEISDDKFTIDNQQVEGFVVEDSNNFMVKFKLHFYRKWKYARSLKVFTFVYDECVDWMF
jgi:hypothetical protein